MSASTGLLPFLAVCTHHYLLATNVPSAPDPRDSIIAALRAEMEEWKFRADHAEAYLQDATTSGGAVRAELEQLQEKVAEREQTTADAIEALVTKLAEAEKERDEARAFGEKAAKLYNDMVLRCSKCSRRAYEPGGCPGCWQSGEPDRHEWRGESCDVARMLQKPRVRYEWRQT